MTTERTEARRAWTVAEAKARLSEILRLAEEEGPQRIGVRTRFVVVPEHMWRDRDEPERIPMGQWIIQNWARGTNLEIPDRHADEDREIPFADWDDDDWGDE